MVPFRNLYGNAMCQIDYSLKLKGTDTDVKDEYGGNIVVYNENNDGFVTIGLKYKYFQRFRSTHEQTEPEFEIIAQGRTKGSTNIKYSSVKARTAFKVKF